MFVLSIDVETWFEISADGFVMTRTHHGARKVSPKQSSADAKMSTSAI